MSDRRYTDDEVQRILASASESDAALGAGASERGLTLEEIQRIAVEAGLSPTSVTAAAKALDVAPATVREQRLLGLKVGVASDVPLPRPLDDAEWRRLVAYLRDTFQAQGREEVGAGRREWRNGRLRIAIEDYGDATVLRMRTRKENADGLVRAGASFVLGGAIAGALGVVMQAAGPPAMAALSVALGGGAMIGAGALQLPRWSATRQQQFEAVAEHARRLTEGGG